MIQVVYSTEHWIVPRIVMVILAILLVAIIVTEGRARVKAGGSFFTKPGKFFIDGADHLKLWGTLVLFIAYIICLDIIGFTVTSILFVFLFNILYAGVGKKSLLLSVLLAVVSSLVVSVLFGVVFNITLPSGFCTMAFPDLGFTLY
jgi:hypothetical protein